MTFEHADVLIVGAGNAALSAREQGVSVTVLECAPWAERGGNTTFTAGAMRVVYDGVDDLRQLMPDLTDEAVESTDFGTYTEEAFFEDMVRGTEFRTDPDLAEVLITRSFDTLDWMRKKGVRFVPIYSRQAFKIDGRFTFWGGVTVESNGGGPGLIESLTEACDAAGIDTLYETRAIGLLRPDDRLTGVRVRHDGAVREITAGSVVLASGGFEANSEWRTRYLGPGWDLAKVRGSRFNVGEGIRIGGGLHDAVDTDVPFGPNLKDGRATHGINPPKTNWANRLGRATLRGVRHDLWDHVHLRRVADRPRPGRGDRRGRSRDPRAGRLRGAGAPAVLLQLP